MRNLAFVAFLLIISCQKKVNPETAFQDSLAHLPIDHSENTDMEVVSTVDHESDSIFYKIDVADNIDKETFLVVKKIYVGDSCFGKYNQGNNAQRARIYAPKTKSGEPTIKYHIRQLKGNNFDELWQVIDRYDCYNYVDLDAGCYTRPKTATQKFNITKFIKIYWRSYDYPDFICANFKSENGQFQFMSKERLETRPEMYRTLGYCIDSISNDYNPNAGQKGTPKSEIDFNGFRDIYNSYWQCNEDLKLAK